MLTISKDAFLPLITVSKRLAWRRIFFTGAFMKLVSIRAKAGLAALALAAVAVPASAQSYASASATLVRYELVDLDLNDGVTPWLSFQDTWGAWSQAMIFPGSSTNGSPLAESTNWSWDMAAVQVDGYSARAQAGTNGVWSSAGGGPNLVSSSAVMQHGFLLSPNTSVTFFFDTALDTSPGGGVNLASAGMKVTFGSDAFPLTEVDVSGGESFSGYLTAFGDAHGTDAVQGRILMATYTETHAAAAPVPEPAAPVMLLGGLGLLTAAGLRRTR
jgi:hypothetical protein